MARSITLTGLVQDDDRNAAWVLPDINAYATGDGVHVEEVATSTGEGTITLNADITGGNGPGAALFINLSTTAAETITIGSTAAQKPILLRASGDGLNWCVINMLAAATTIKHQAASGTPRLYVAVFEAAA